MRFGLDVSQHQLTWNELVRRTRFAEDSGFDGAWVFDHFKALYGDPFGPCLEGWTLLAGLAAVTERIRLGALVTGVTYRHPSILATQAITVDHISNGRLEMAIGAAWFEREHEELGIDFPSSRERIERLEEAVTVIDLLMTTDGATFEGRHFRLSDATYNPRPVQQPRPPLWIGASGERRSIPVAARHADVWHGFGDAASLQRRMRVLEEAAEAAGRDPSEIARSTALSISEPIDEIARRVDELQELGFDYLTVSWPGQGDAKVEDFVEKVMARFIA
ncbi:MAG: TIGR03560 family F420-dependent LLM class oxidoreductase [Actinomycetota bacterium]